MATETIKMEKGLLNTQIFTCTRIRTLIAEAGRKLRAATETIKMEKGESRFLDS